MKVFIGIPTEGKINVDLANFLLNVSKVFPEDYKIYVSFSSNMTPVDYARNFLVVS